MFLDQSEDRKDQGVSHGVAADDAELLDVLAVPFGTYVGVATCYPVPGAPRWPTSSPTFCAPSARPTPSRDGNGCLYDSAFGYFRLGYASAIALTMLVATAVIVWVQYRLARRWRLV